MKTTYLYIGVAASIIGIVTGSLWHSTGETGSAGVFAVLTLIILVLGWAAGASAQQQANRSPVAFALSIGSITNAITTVFSRAEAEIELAALNPPGQYPFWRIVPLYCDDPQFTETERTHRRSQCCGSIEFCSHGKCLLTAASDTAINQPLV